MGHYKSNLRDIEFNLFEFLRRQDVLGTGPFEDVDPDTARGILGEVERLASGPIAESFAEADRNPPVFDPATNSVRMPAGFKKSFKAFMDAEWYRLELPDELGGTGAPRSLNWAVAELILGANPAVWMYASGAEHDMAENIFHLVLARPEGHGPGTKGLSMFLVPKYLVGEDGTLGERNGVYATGVEHKMGLKASTTCELTFGGSRPAVGTLIGDVHDGIRQMFVIIEHARMMVGTKAIETLSTGYLNALDFARIRVQGADLTQMLDKTAPRVEIIRHPDVR